MAINKKLIHFKKYSDFIGSKGINGTTSPTNGNYNNIPANAIVFILDTKQIWTHGQYYNCPYTQEEIAALLNNKADTSDLDNYLTTKAAESLATKAELTEGINAKYTKPNTGIPKDHLASAVLTSLGKADTALLSIPSEYITETELAAKGYTTNIGTITGIKMNGASKGTSGIVDLGTVITSIPVANGDTSGVVESGGDVTISNGIITVNDDSHNHVISNIDGLQDALAAKLNVITKNVTYTGDLVGEQVATFEGTTGTIKASGFTIAKSVPSTAVFTDTTSFNISAGATDDDVIVLTGTPGTNGVSYDAKHAKKFSTSNSTYTSGNTTTSISGSGGKGTIKIPQITVDSYGHVTAAADESVTITMPSVPVTSVAGKTGAVTLAKTDVGLGNVDNTSDANKPISSATQAALNGKAATSHASTATTYGVGTTANYGHVKISNGDADTVGTADGLVAGMDHTHSLLAPKASPTFTGTPKAPTATKGTNTTQVATTAFVQEAIPTTLKNPNALTIGGQTYDGSAKVTITAADLGLSSALKYHGTTTTALTDGATTKPIVIGGSDHYQEQGCVVAYNNSSFVWTGSAWEELGNPGNYKVIQDAVSSPSASGNATAFIDTISLDANGKITTTKKNVLTASTSAYGITKLSSATDSTSEALAATPKAVKTVYDLANSKWTYNADTIKAIKVNTASTADVANSVNWTKVNNKPTKLSQFNDDVVAGKYLPLTGGTISGFFAINGSIASYTQYKVNNAVKGEVGWHSNYGIFIKNETSKKFLNITDEGLAQFDGKTVIHSGNIGSQVVEGINTHTSSAINAGGDIAKLNSYYGAGIFKISRFNGLGGLGTANSDGLIVNWPLDRTYGQQWYIDDESHTIQTRYVANGSWSSFKTIAFTDSNVASSAKLSYTGDTFGGGETGVVYKTFQDASKVGADGINGDWSIPEGTGDSTSGCAQILRLSYGINNHYNDLYFGPNTMNGIWWRLVTDNVNQPWYKVMMVNKDLIYAEKLKVSTNSGNIAMFTSNSNTESSVAYIGSDGLEWIAGKGCYGTGDTFCVWSRTLDKNVLVCHATKRVSIGKNTADEALDVEGNIKVENGNFIGNLTGTASNAAAVNGTKIAIVSEMPSSPDSSTLYFVK